MFDLEKMGRGHNIHVTTISVQPYGNECFALVEVHTDKGIRGIGSTGSPNPVIAAIIEAAPHSLAEFLVGEDPRNIKRLWDRMFQDWQAMRGRGAEGGLAVNAMGAIDMAFWDIAGKLGGLPVSRLLNSESVKARVMAYASAIAFDRSSTSMKNRNWPFKSADQLANEARLLVNQGFKGVKYGWGNKFGPEEEEKLAAIREGLGSEVKFMIDVGCPAYWGKDWDLYSAIKAVQLLEKYNVYFIEEALPPFDVEGFAKLKKESPIKLATGESLTTIYDFQRLIEKQAVDVVQPDAAQMGITQVIEVARMAESANILCIPHSPWSALAVASHLHILAAVSNGPMIEYPAMASFQGTEWYNRCNMTFYDIIEDPLKLENGYLIVPKGPGLGLGNFTEKVLE